MLQPGPLCIRVCVLCLVHGQAMEASVDCMCIHGVPRSGRRAPLGVLECPFSAPRGLCQCGGALGLGFGLGLG